MMSNAEMTDPVSGTEGLLANAPPFQNSQRAMSLLLLAHLPFTVLYYWQLFSLPHYRFFPLALVAVAFLFFRRRNSQVERWNWLARFLLFCDVLCLAAAMVLAQPWLAVAGLMLCLAGWCMASRGKDYTGSLLSLTVIPLTTLRVPGEVDEQLLSWLRDKCFQGVSKFCHRIDLIHYTKDDTLFFAEKSFTSADLTRSAVFLFFTMCLAAVIAGYQRRSFLHAVLVVFSGGVISASLTLLRAIAAVWLWQRYSVDLTVGVAGVATDVFLVVLSAGCLLSADAFWDIFTKVVPDIVRMGPVKSFRNPFIFLWNRWVATAMPNPESAETPVSALFPGATSVFAGVLVISVLGQLADWLLKRVV